MPLALLSALLVVGPLSACKDDPASPAESPSALLQVPTAGVDRVGNTARVVFTVENRSGDLLLLKRCGEIVWVAAERFIDGAWQQYISGICPTIYEQARTQLPAGQSLTGIVNIAQAGRYRLLIDVGNRSITSAAFEVR